MVEVSHLSKPLSLHIDLLISLCLFEVNTPMLGGEKTFPFIFYVWSSIPSFLPPRSTFRLKSFSEIPHRPHLHPPILPYLFRFYYFFIQKPYFCPFWSHPTTFIISQESLELEGPLQSLKLRNNTTKNQENQENIFVAQGAKQTDTTMPDIGADCENINSQRWTAWTSKS